MTWRIRAATLIVAATICGTAQAETLVDWRGGLIVKTVNATTCTNLFGAGRLREFSARYRHPGLADNGADAKLSFFNANFAFNIKKVGGNFLVKTQETVDGVSMAGGVAIYKPILTITSMVPAPASITPSTPQITIIGTIKNFSGFPTSAQCVISFEATVFNP